MIIAARNGALICIDDVEAILALGNGGFKLDAPFSPQRLFELSKMDGAIILSNGGSEIVRANFHLNPNPSLQTEETGMRHRTAARTSMQTDAMVISVSKRRAMVNVYINGQGVTLDSDEILLSKANQGILALQNSKNTLDKAIIRQTLLEFDDLATVVDVTSLLARYSNLSSIATQTERQIGYLGTNGVLLRLQLDEIMQGVYNSFVLTVRDYASTSSPAEAKRIVTELAELSRAELTTKKIVSVLGLPTSLAAESHLSARGFRVISRISMLDEAATAQIIEEYGTLSAIVSDAEEGFDRLGNIGVDNVRAIAASFMQLRGAFG